jgi:hypothetical protein
MNLNAHLVGSENLPGPDVPVVLKNRAEERDWIAPSQRSVVVDPIDFISRILAHQRTYVSLLANLQAVSPSQGQDHKEC